MLELYINIQSNIKYEEGVPVFGQQAFEKYTHTIIGSDTTKITLLDNFNKELDEFGKNNHMFLSSYFRTLYRIIKFVNDYKDVYEQIDKKHFVNLIRAQISTFELVLLFCNGLTVEGQKFKKLIEEYSFFEHLTDMQFFKTWDIKIIQEYDILAFGNGVFSSEENQKLAFYINEN